MLTSCLLAVFPASHSRVGGIVMWNSGMPDEEHQSGTKKRLIWWIRWYEL